MTKIELIQEFLEKLYPINVNKWWYILMLAGSIGLMANAYLLPGTLNQFVFKYNLTSENPMIFVAIVALNLHYWMILLLMSYSFVGSIIQTIRDFCSNGSE